MSEERYLVLSALGPDRPGLVAQVTHFIADRNGNIQDSRMAVLGGEFGMLVLFSGPEKQMDRLIQEIAQLEEKTGLKLLIRKTISPEAHRRSSVVPLAITASALDHEGIVMALATALYEVGVNILSLQTTAYNAPETGTPLFKLEALVETPRSLSIGEIHRALGVVAQAENLDIEVRAIVV